MLIYKITNRMNGKIYIGKTERKSVNRRWNEHVSQTKKGSSLYFHKAIRKYGPDVFKIEVVGHAKTSDELIDIEKFFIASYQSNNSKKGYNLTLGGEGTVGYKRTPEQVEAIRQRQLGQSPSKEARERSSKTHKELWKARSSESKITILAHLQSVCSMGAKPLKGRKRSVAVRLAISKGRSGIGRPQPREVREKIAATMCLKNQLKKASMVVGG